MKTKKLMVSYLMISRSWDYLLATLPNTRGANIKENEEKIRPLFYRTKMKTLTVTSRHSKLRSRWKSGGY